MSPARRVIGRLLHPGQGWAATLDADLCWHATDPLIEVRLRFDDAVCERSSPAGEGTALAVLLRAAQHLGAHLEVLDDRALL